MSTDPVLEGIEGLDRPEILSWVFHPRPDTLPPLEGNFAEEHLFEVAPGVSIGSILFTSGHHLPTIIFFHGNGEIARDYDGIAPLFTQRGMNLWVLDYRGYGRSTGTPSLRSMMDDALHLFQMSKRTLEQEGFKGPLWVMGRSLGSAPAIYVAKHHQGDLQGLILESGFADALGLLGRLGLFTGRPPMDPNVSLFNLRSIQQVRLPTLVIHGEWDEIIPLEEGKALYQASGSRKKELVVIPQAGHNDLLWVGLDRYMNALETFVKKAPGNGAA